MNVTCPQCRSVFRLDPAKITSVALRARCSVCGGIIPVGASVRWSDDLTAPRPTPSGAAPARPQPAPHDTPGGVKVRTRTPPFASRVSAPTPASGGPAEAPRAPSSAAPTAPPRAPSSPTPASATPAPPSFGAPLRPPPRNPIPEPPRQAGRPAGGQPTPSPFRAAGDSAAAFSTPSTPSTPTPQAAPTGKRPINPFLANDPNHKARRLARALVSDMVTYHPTKREEGLKSGTLKQVFREEIKKSYEEYVEQVGREFAESTTHFQDALNDVLAGGRKIF
jgi:predicted Zn finger-like uncharacterized protein